jgi:hypothetical protein
MAHTKRRSRYSRKIGKRGRTIKRRLYAYYKKIVNYTRTAKGKKKGG